MAKVKCPYCDHEFEAFEREGELTPVDGDEVYRHFKRRHPNELDVMLSEALESLLKLLKEKL